jgi:hypothetical protein
MKVLAILTLKPEVKLDAVSAELANEIRGSWALYASGVLREAYATEVPSRVVFVIEAGNARDAELLSGRFRSSQPGCLTLS